MTEGKFIPGNQSADTPDLSETELRGMQMRQLIELARQEGIEGIDGMRRDDLIREISARHRQRRQQMAGAGSQQQAGGQGQAGGGGQQQAQAGGGGQATEGKFIPGNQSANTPDLSETELRGMQMPQLRELARQEGVQGADELRRDDLIKAISARHRELHPQA
jgi:transcription termination factor Rho